MTAREWARLGRVGWYVATALVLWWIPAWTLLSWGWIRPNTFAALGWIAFVANVVVMTGAMVCEVYAGRAYRRAENFRNTLARSGIRAGDWAAATAPVRHRRPPRRVTTSTSHDQRRGR